MGRYHFEDLFDEVFAEWLGKRGFVKCRGGYPYYARVVGDEIVHLISYRYDYHYDSRSFIITRYFDVMGGLVTAYRHTVRILHEPSSIVTYMHPLKDFYLYENYQNYDKEYFQSLDKIGKYNEDDEASMKQAMREIRDAAERMILPRLDQVTDMDSCIKFYEEFYGDSLMIPEYDAERDSFGCEYDEGFLYIGTGRQDDFVPETEERIARRCTQLDAYDIEFSPELIRKKTEEKRKTLVARRDRIFRDPVLLERAREEMEKCRRRNVPNLQGYGLSI